MSLASEIKFGAGIPWAMPGDTYQPDTLLETAKICEETGYDSLWVGDHLLHFPGLIVPESWTLLSAVTMVTNKPKLGTAVTDPHRHHPAVLAQRLATLDHFAKGRIILGLGPGTAINLDSFNIGWEKPVSKLEEYVKILRRLWSGERFSHDGRFWQFKDAHLQIKPYNDSIPIYFASNRPRMLKLTGRYADGWIPLGLTPKMYKKRIASLRDSANTAGRSLSDIDTGLYLGVCMSDKLDELALIDGWKGILVPEALLEAGYDLPEKQKSYHYLDWESNSEYMGQIAEYSSHVPDDAVKEFFVVGSPDECIEKVDEFNKAGVRHFVFEFMSLDHERMARGFQSQVLSHFIE